MYCKKDINYEKSFRFLEYGSLKEKHLIFLYQKYVRKIKFLEELSFYIVIILMAVFFNKRYI